jgi:putative two-component system protein, hydrogenase maturation factor HypX/HoxX
MRILVLATGFNSLTQRGCVGLVDAGHDLAVNVVRDASDMAAAVESFPPDVIVAPYLKSVIPESIWRAYTCLIVHPGIRGDQGPSSLDWAILRGEQTWGVTVVQATAELDAGGVWAYREFPMRLASKSALYRHEVADAAAAAVLEALTRFENGYIPEPLDRQPDVRGRLEPLMKQQDRVIDWAAPTDIVLRKLLCSDSNPGVLDTLFGQRYYLFGGHREEQLGGPPGELVAQRAGAVCRATGDGAVWITHLKPTKVADTTFFKLPATAVLANHLSTVPKLDSPLAGTGDAGTYRQIWYEEHDDVGYLHFEFYNGAMSTHQCRVLRDAYLWARQRPTKVIVLMGGQDLWSNGIDLNAIEAAASPERESWLNINAMNNVVREIITTSSHWVISALAGNAGAGGVPLALAADEVCVRSGIVLNPYYKKMGLYGSEYWTYLLPRRVGDEWALDLTEGCLPIGTRMAKEVGLIDNIFGPDLTGFRSTVGHFAESIARSADFELRLHLKRQARQRDERTKALRAYRGEELAKMAVNFGDPHYHQTRQDFVYKRQPAGSSSGFQLAHRLTRPLDRANAAAYQHLTTH